MENGFSKRNQRLPNAAYRFGDFELYPNDRLLQNAGSPIPLQPKSFDALLCLLRRAQHLVSKEELTTTLWPSISVSEANLTNIIVSLRKVLGRDAIRTVSKYGYRFDIPVALEPGIPPTTYKNFVRAKALVAQRSVDTMHIARDLLWTCLAEEPCFASAWAWLGRCCWFLNKFGGHSAASKELTQAVFQRAFALDSDLASAHEFYTFFQVDSGNASDAMVRLLERLKHRPGEPESYVGLVQVLRCRGLLEESIEAHRRATALDPSILSSVAHTMFLCGSYSSAIEAYAGRSAYYLDAASWAALGNRKYAIGLLRERLETLTLSRLIQTLLASLLAVLEKRTDEAIHLMQGADTMHEPEIMVYFARHYAVLGLPELAEKALRQAAAAGFICAPDTLKNDSWLKSLRQHTGFPSLLHSMEVLVDEARSSMKEHPIHAKSRGAGSSRTKRVRS
jgi:DNA-binding winged helix-turn-helix (wHTH) protein